MKPELYFSTDVETDGPIPGPNSMLSLGSAAFNEDGECVSTFYMNLDFLHGAQHDPRTMEWWKTQPRAWEASRQDTQHPVEVMSRFAEWIEDLCKQTGCSPVFVGYPAGFDFMFVYWYLMRFVGRSPFGFSALDIKSYASAVLGMKYRQTRKKTMPKEWFTDTPHDHTALNDAIGQGELFANILNVNRKKERG